MIALLLVNHSRYRSTMGGGEGSSGGEVVTGIVVRVMAMTRDCMSGGGDAEHGGNGA